jgi:hypothetical protein
MKSVLILKVVRSKNELPPLIKNSDGSRKYRLSAIMGYSDAGEAFLDTVYAVLSTRETTKINHLDSLSRELNITNPTESKLGKALLSRLMNRKPDADDQSLKTLQCLIDSHLVLDLSELGILILDENDNLNPRLPKRETLKSKINTLDEDSCFVLASYTQL